MIRNIVFDVGSVLVRVRPEEALTDLGFARDRAEATVRAALGNPVWRELDRGVMKKEDVFAAMVENNRTQKRYSGLKTRLCAAEA